MSRLLTEQQMEAIEEFSNMDSEDEMGERLNEIFDAFHDDQMFDSLGG